MTNPLCKYCYSDVIILSSGIHAADDTHSDPCGLPAVIISMVDTKGQMAAGEYQPTCETVVMSGVRDRGKT